MALVRLVRVSNGGRVTRTREEPIMDVTTVVVGYDGSQCAQRAVEAALAVVDPGGTVHLVLAYDAPTARQVANAYAAVPSDYTASIDLLNGPRSDLEDAAKWVVDQGYAVVDHFVENDPAAAILHVANDVFADMIVVGSRGLGRAAQVLRGSVSTKIAHASPVDFMVIH